MYKTPLCRLLITSAICLQPLTAQAQDTISDIGVPRLPEMTERTPAQADAVARLRYGGWVGLQYQDNIYRDNANEESDFIAVAAPGISLRSETDAHKAKLRLRAEGGAYLNNSENDYADVRADGTSVYALTPTLSLLTDAGLRRDHVAIGAFVDNPDRAASEPTIYYQAEGNIGLQADNGTYYGLVKTGLNYLNYDNADARGGGVVINDDRDRTEWQSLARVGVYAAPKWLAYAQGSINTRNYRTQIDSTALLEKDSNGYGAALGVAYAQEGQPLWLDMNAGYLSQDYDDPMLKDIDTLGMEARSRWELSDTFALHASATRSVEENTLFGASGHIMTRARAGFDYAFAPAWELEGDIRFTHNDFELNPALGRIGRKDDIWDTSVLVAYNFFANYYVGAEYIYVNRDSTQRDAEYTTNAAIVRLSLKY